MNTPQQRNPVIRGVCRLDAALAGFAASSTQCTCMLAPHRPSPGDESKPILGRLVTGSSPARTAKRLGCTGTGPGHARCTDVNACGSGGGQSTTTPSSAFRHSYNTPHSNTGATDHHHAFNNWTVQQQALHSVAKSPVSSQPHGSTTMHAASKPAVCAPHLCWCRRPCLVMCVICHFLRRAPRCRLVCACSTHLF